MKILIIGGTVFVGRHLVLAAKARGHEVTLFHRGKHNPGLFPDVETLTGDRLEPADFAQLEGRKFDAVVDTCGYFPRAVRISTEALKDKTDLYCFISTVSVYKDFTKGNVTEDDALGTIDDPTIEEVTGETYGPLKVLCEQAAEEAFPSKTLVIRPGLIVGPYDISDRFTYWPHRVAEGGEVLAPESPDLHTQFIDVRDLAEWNVHLLARGVTGVFNATGPDYPLTFGELLETCQTVSGSDARFTWLPAEFLEEQGVKPWMELPLWIPSSMGEPGHDRVNIDRGLAKGLTIRPLSETVRDTLLWDHARPQENTWRNTLTREKEQAVLSEWSKRQGG
jgi:2'-hydroxyisoflavone reductase